MIIDIKSLAHAANLVYGVSAHVSLAKQFSFMYVCQMEHPNQIL